MHHPPNFRYRASSRLSFAAAALLSAVGCGSVTADSGSPDGADEDAALEITGEDAQAIASSAHTTMVLFQGNTNGFHSFRIPSIVTTTSGSLLAFAEGRRDNNDDRGNSNVVFKRSTDHGVTWSSLGTVAGVGSNTWGNPTAVVDRDTNRVWLFMAWSISEQNDPPQPDEWGDRRVYSSYSDDDGITWSTPVNRTATLLPPNFTWDHLGPGTGIQTLFGAHAGRLVIPALGRNIYSDDHGVTWSYASLRPLSEDLATSESTVVELLNGQLLRNDRPVRSTWNNQDSSKRRFVSVGSIGSVFPAFKPHSALVEPLCQGSTLRYTAQEKSRILFLNPTPTTAELADLEPGERGDRCKMRIRISYDEGATWPVSRRIYDTMTIKEECKLGKGGYSSMTKTADLRIGALIEDRGEEPGEDPKEHHISIDFHKFGLQWILNGVSEP